MKDEGGWDTRVHIFTVTPLRRDRVTSPTLGRRYPQYSFYTTLSGRQDQSEYERVEKISTARPPVGNALPFELPSPLLIKWPGVGFVLDSNLP